MSLAPLLTIACLSLGQTPSPQPDPKPNPPAAANLTDPFVADPSWKSLGQSLWFDPKGRRLIVRARVVLREGPLEHLLCLKGTKEHEAILATSAPAKKIHAGLLLTGAEVGHPVRFLPHFEPPAGTKIAIDLEWLENGKTKRADARDWVFDEAKKAPLKVDWVFAGSEIVKDPITKQPYYLADDGDLITVANFGSSILDLPFASTANDTERSYVAGTERIPPKGTLVTMIMRPRPEKAGPAKSP